MRTAIVTGGTSGIGLAIARRLVADGASVDVWGRDPARGASAQAVLADAGPGRATFVACDVRSADAIRAAVASFRERHERVDLLVNAAGVRRVTPLASFDPVAIAEQIETNLTGAIMTTSALCGALARPGGVVVNVASVVGREAFPSLGAYGAAKAGLVHFTRTAAKELFAEGVRVVCICPGAVDTPMYSKLEGMFLTKMVPRHRMQRPEEIVEAVMWLSSAASSSMTGAVVDVDDGVSLFPGGPADVPKPTSKPPS